MLEILSIGARRFVRWLTLIMALILQVEGTSVLHKIGQVTFAGSDAGTIWAEGATVPDYPFQSSAVVLEVVSGSDNDGAGDDSGCSTVTVVGLDADWEIQETDVEMSGTTAVDLTGTWLRVNRASCAVAGSGGTNAGAITVRVDGAGDTQAVMNAGDGETLQAVFSTASEQRFLMLGWEVSWSSNNPGGVANCKLFGRSAGGAVRIIDIKYFRGQDTPQPTRWDRTSPLVIAQQSDVYIYCETTVSATMTGQFYGNLGSAN